MREWLLLGVLALGGILGAWLLIFKSLAALYEMWQSGREFDRLKREAASRRQQRPSELMQKQTLPVKDDHPNMPEIPASLLEGLSDEEADPLLVPRKADPAASPQAGAVPPPQGGTPPEQPPPAPSPPAEKWDDSTTSTPPPTFPLPAADNKVPDEEPAESPDAPPPPADDPSESPATEDLPQHPPRYDQ